MLHGVARMEDHSEFEKVFKYNGFYMDARALVKATKHTWTTYKDNRTKYKVLDDITRWHELTALGIEGQLAANLWDDYYILTDGVVLKKYYVVNSNKGVVELIENKCRIQHYVSDLLYFGFLDRNYDPAIKETKFEGFNDRQPTLDNVVLKARYVAKKQSKNKDTAKPTKVVQPISKPQVSKKASPQSFDPFDPLAGWLPADEDWN